MRTVLRAVRRVNGRSFNSAATFDHKVWSKWREELSFRSHWSGPSLYKRVLGRRDVNDDYDEGKTASEELQSFWDDTNELAKTFGTPELDDQVRFFISLCCLASQRWLNRSFQGRSTCKATRRRLRPPNASTSSTTASSSWIISAVLSSAVYGPELELQSRNF